MSKRLGIIIIVVALAIGLAVVGWGKYSVQKSSDSAMDVHDMAVAVLSPTSSSKASGRVTFSKMESGIRVVASLQGLTPGPHTLQISRVGDCSELNHAYVSPGSMGSSEMESKTPTVGKAPDPTMSANKSSSNDSDHSKTPGTYGAEERGLSSQDSDASLSGTSASDGAMTRIITADSNGKVYLEWVDTTMKLTGSSSLVGAAVVVYATDHTSGDNELNDPGSPGTGSSGPGGTFSKTPTSSDLSPGNRSMGTSGTGTYSSSTGDAGRDKETRRNSMPGSMGTSSDMLVACGMIEAES